jgi:GEVED domain/Secretion system C-terminal sorting domain/CARDB
MFIKSHLFLSLFFLFLTTKSHFFNDYSGSTLTEKQVRKIKNHAAHDEWWLRRYADPALGAIPNNRLYDAMLTAQDITENMAFDRTGLADLTWKERGPSNVGGHLNDICFDKSDLTGNTLWFASNGGGLWKTQDAFSAIHPTYTKVAENQLPAKISSIQQHPTDPNILYLSSYSPGGIWKSVDKGATWLKIRNSNASILYYSRIDLEILADGTLLVGDFANMYRTTDAGATWTTVFSGQYIQDIESSSNGKVFMLTGKNVYWSENNGVTWSLRSSGLLGNNYYCSGRLAVAPTNPDRVYALIPIPAQNFGKFDFYKTSDAGASWQKLAVPTTSLGVTWANALAVDPNNQDRVFMGSLNFQVTNDGGVNMTGFAPNMHVDQQCIAFAPNNSSKIWIGNDGGLHRSSNANVTTPTVEVKNNDFNTSELYAVNPHPNADNNEMLVGAQDNGTHRLNASEISPSQAKILSGDGANCFFDEDQPNIQVVAAQNNFQFITNNNWATYTSINVTGGEFIASTDYDSKLNVLYAPQTNRSGYAYIENVGGTNLLNKVNFPSTLGVPYYNLVTAIHISPNTSNTIYIGNADGYVFKVQNANSLTPNINVIRIREGNSRNISCITIEKGNENHVILSYSNYGVISLEETLDGGATWKSIEGNLPDMPINWCILNPNNAKEVLLATDLGIWATTDLNENTTQWMPLNAGFPQNVQVMQMRLRASDKMLYAATYGRGVFTSDYFKINGNNVNGTITDLIPGFFSAPNSSVLNGANTISFSINNQSSALASLVNYSVYLSNDAILDANDVVLVNGTNAGIAPNASAIVNTNINIPSNVSAGNYNLILKIDPSNLILETNENNNTLTRLIQILALPTDYCVSKSDFPWHEWITGVKIGNFNLVSGKSSYTFNQQNTVILPKNTSQTITLSNGFSYSTFDEYWKVWIDFNQNNIFEEPQEIAAIGKINRPPDGTFSYVLNTALTIPLNATSGLTRMRVSMKRGDYPTPCETLAFGEVEDFLVQITGNLAPGIPNTFQDNPLKEVEANLVYPNPANDFAYVNLENYENLPAELQIFNIKGNVQKCLKLDENHGKTAVLDLSDFDNGVYFIKIINKGKKDVVRKLVVTRNF